LCPQGILPIPSYVAILMEAGIQLSEPAVSREKTNSIKDSACFSKGWPNAKIGRQYKATHFQHRLYHYFGYLKEST
jgi:hypothetical protein